MFKSTLFTAALALSTPAMLLAQTAPGPDTIVVLDVSNSMWGQIDGVSKIEIAREVIADLLGDIDPSARFGLVAYGHREKASCQDIELVLPVGPLEAASFSAAVYNLTPRGRTPLTEAVRQAAEVLNYRDHPSRIILVSDGLESCNADPCALAAELARGGVDLTAPAEVETGALLEATWQAPTRQGDEIYMISDNGEVFASVDATQGPPATFTAPAVIGQYAVVYRDRDGKDLFPRRFHRGA